MSNVTVRTEGPFAYGTLYDGHVFTFDSDKVYIVLAQNWYYCWCSKMKRAYIRNRAGQPLHKFLTDCPKGFEVDHINLDTMDNRSSNLRLTTHQQNQCNQPLQKNNTSGVTGVRFYKRRNKYTARIKVAQHDIHLGYYVSFTEAVQARNVGMECMFGEYGRYNEVPPAPEWIRKQVIEKCKRFAELSLCKAFLLSENLA